MLLGEAPSRNNHLAEAPAEPPAKLLAIDLVDRNRQLLGQAERHGYVSRGSGELAAHLFFPQGWRAEERRPFIAFFFSSQWDQGTITQFAPHALYFSSLGAVCGLFEYRTAASGSETGAAALDAMADARSAIRWVRANASVLGVDPGKVTGSGACCGAHAVLSAAMSGDAFDEPNDDTTISCVPDALLLFASVLDTSKRGYGFESFPTPELAKAASPLAQVRTDIPPIILFHGAEDQILPVATSRRFQKKMRRKGNICELVEFGGQPHSFYNFNGDVQVYAAAVDAGAEFLAKHGMLDPAPLDT